METVDWVPVDVAADVMVELALEGRMDEKLHETERWFHLVNPRTVAWGKLWPVVKEYYKEKGKELEVVSFEEWLKALKDMPATRENAERVPGLKLLDFFEGLAAPQGLPRLATEKTEATSRTLRELGAVTEDMMKQWLGQWQF